MAKGINKITLMGNLAKDPDVRSTQGRQKVAAFTLAVNDDYKSKSGEEVKSTDFIPCVAWGNQAGVVERYLSKGAPVLLFGKLKVESYTDKNGQKRCATRVHVSEIYLLSHFAARDAADSGEDYGGYTGGCRQNGGFDEAQDAAVPF